MSRNFELLRRAEEESAAQQTREVERQREQLQKQAVLEPQSAASPASDAVNGHRASLEIDALARDEVSKLVQRLFLLPGASKVVTFTAVEKGDGCTWLTSRVAD